MRVVQPGLRHHLAPGCPCPAAHRLFPETRDPPMPDSTSPIKYHSVEELQKMPREELTALLAQLPTEPTVSYKLLYAGCLRRQGVATLVGSAGLEQDLILALLTV